MEEHDAPSRVGSNQFVLLRLVTNSIVSWLGLVLLFFLKYFSENDSNLDIICHNSSSIQHIGVEGTQLFNVCPLASFVHRQSPVI